MKKSIITIKNILSRLDYWRNFPSYQLERHVDVIFSFYLKQILKEKFKTEISDYVIPEFPLNQNITKENPREGEYSDNVDFVVPSKNLDTIYFVELKTDMGSIRKDQDLLMVKCNGMIFQNILQGLIDITIATKEYSKYANLLYCFDKIGYIDVPNDFWKLNFKQSPYGYKSKVREVKVKPLDTKVVSLYIQPEQSKREITTIDFIEISNILYTVDKTFSEYLVKWANSPGFYEGN